ELVRQRARLGLSEPERRLELPDALALRAHELALGRELVRARGGRRRRAPAARRGGRGAAAQREHERDEESTGSPHASHLRAIVERRAARGPIIRRTTAG